jgi:hypothetical protein
MMSVLRFTVADDETGFLDAADTALRVLAARTGYLRGSVGRATDEPEQWVLVTEWLDVGSYRRALGNYEVKIHAQPLLSQALDDASSFEVLVDAAPGAEPVRYLSDLDTLT